MAYYRTSSERTVSLTASLSVDLRSNDANAPYDSLTGRARAYIGTRAASGIPAPICFLEINGGTVAVSQFIDSSAAAIAPAAFPGLTHDVSWTATASITFSITLQQVQDGAIMTERVKPGNFHSLAYNLSTYGRAASGTLSISEASAAHLMTFYDFCGFVDVLSDARGQGGTSLATIDLSGWAANWNATSGSYTWTPDGSAAESASVTSGGVLTASVTTTCASAHAVAGTASAVANPRLDFQASIEPYFFDMLYGGQYKVKAAWSNTQASQTNVSATGPLRSDQLYGAFTGVTTISETPGGLAYVGLGGTASTYTVGDRMNGMSSWTIVSPSTTLPSSPIAHPDHPIGDVYGVRFDQSDGLLISHDGARTIDDGSTITPSGGEWISMSGGGSVALASGVKLTAGGSTSVFRRGWAMWSLGSLVSGAVLDTRAHRFVTLTLTSTSAYTLWVHLPGATTAIYGQGEGEDPGSSQGQLGGKRWKINVLSGTNAYRIDLCNPDYWPLGGSEQHIDPPYQSGALGSGPPEGYGLADYPAYRNAPDWKTSHGNFSGQAAWSRMVFVLPASKILTVNSISLDAPTEMCADAGEGVIAVFIDGMLVQHFSAASGVSVSSCRALLDAPAGLTCTTSLTNGAGSAPAAYSLRSDWEQWRGQSVDRIYWGSASTNLNRTGASSVGLEWPRISSYLFWHPGGKCVDVGSAYGPTIFLTLRARFGGSFGGLAFREEHAMGDGSVAVAGDASYAVDALGRWGYGSSRPRLETLSTRIVTWDGWSTLAIKAGAGGRGIRRWVSFKGAALYVPYSNLSAHTSASGQTAWAGVRGGDILTGWAVDFATATWEERATGFSGTRPHLRFDRSDAGGRAYLLFEAGGAVKLSWSDDGGRSWASAMSIWASGAGHPAGDVSGGGFLLAAARITSGGAIEVKAIDRLGNVLFTATALTSGAASDSIPVTWDYTAQRWYLLYLDGGGAIQRKESADDGRTWT